MRIFLFKLIQISLLFLSLVDASAEGNEHHELGILDINSSVSIMSTKLADDDLITVEVSFESNNIFLSIVYTMSTLTAIVSNLIVILVYLFGYGGKTDLSIFLVNLAVADFLMSTFCMPFTFAQVLLNEWIFGEIMCPVVLFKQVLTVSLSIYTMVAIGIDRYHAIKCPLKNRVTNKRGKTTIFCVWLLSFSLGSVQLFVARVLPALPVNATQNDTYSKSPLEIKYQCNENWPSEKLRRSYTVFNFFAVYLIPVAILAYTYACIGNIIKQSTHPGNVDISRDQHYNKSKNKLIKMLILLVSAFTLCWLPLHMFILLGDFTSLFNMFPTKTITWCYYLAHWLAMTNCTINPFIYGYSNKKFRSDVYSLLICRSKRNLKHRNESSKTATYLLPRYPNSSRMAINSSFNNSQRKK